MKSNYTIEWNSPDGEGVNLIFLILSPKGEDSQQLGALHAISKFTSNEENRQNLIKNTETLKLKEIFEN